MLQHHDKIAMLFASIFMFERCQLLVLHQLLTRLLFASIHDRTLSAAGTAPTVQGGRGITTPRQDRHVVRLHIHDRTLPAAGTAPTVLGGRGITTQDRHCACAVAPTVLGGRGDQHHDKIAVLFASIFMIERCQLLVLHQLFKVDEG